MMAINPIDQPHIKNSKLLHHNIKEDKEETYLHKFLISISFVGIFFLKYILPPLFKIPKNLEKLLNNNIKDEESPFYKSIVAHIDTRIDLDKGIKQEDGRYLPVLTMMASKLAYENKAFIRLVVSHHWKMIFEGFHTLYNEFRDAPETQAFIFRDTTGKNEKVVVAFRGTSPFSPDDWSTDIDLQWCQLENMPGKLHRGFLAALGLRKSKQNSKNIENPDDCYYQWPKDIDPSYGNLAYYKIRDELRRILSENSNAKIIVTGHSLGGALAILFPSILVLHEATDLLDRLEAIYTFGQPKVGDQVFAENMDKNLKDHNVKYYRIVYSCDAVPNVPWDIAAMRFKHFGTCIRFNSLYQAKIDNGGPSLGENLVYFNKGLKWLMVWIIYVMNAVWELIRGFIIEIIAGPDFRESWTLIVSRILTIKFPCLIAHNPQDYVNATRLASPDLFHY